VTATARWGRLVAQRRAAHGLTQRELAERAGISLAAVRDLEQGRVREPRPGTADRIAAVLEMAAPGGGLRVQVLGPLRVLSAGLPVILGSAAQRHLLGLLALAGGQVVRRTRLVEVLWGADPPSGVAALLHTHVSRLRRRLGVPGLITTTVDGGYRLDAALAGLDTEAFQRGYERARRLGPGEPALAAYAYAASLWRGHPIEDLPALQTDPAVTTLALHRQRFVLEYADTAAALGRHEQVLPLLRGLVDADPLDEAAHERMMAALVATGRQAAAVALYAALRKRLADELGVDPATGLRLLHGRILRGTAGSRSDVPSTVPADRLPASIAGFVGRRDELCRLDAMLAAAEPGTAPVAVISGPAGAGKTTLAVHWAHRVRERFPDGQLYLNLRGFDPVGPPTSPAEALPVLLQTLQVSAEQIPPTLAAQVGLYRGVLADRRMLIVLDNVRDADQVRPLLPGPSSCVLITSRSQLTSLVVVDGANPLPLDLLSAAEARELLVRRLGAARVAAEPGAVDDIIARCARLPLALAIVAARAATHPRFVLAGLTGGPDGLRAGLDAFDGGDHATQVRTVFSWSYLTLTADAARLFRLLGLHPGPDIAAPAAASLAGAPPGQVGPLLAELAQAHLVTEHAPGRYTFHDLLRAYAVELAHIHDRDTGRRAATHRLLDHYLHSAHTAHRQLNPHRDPITLSPPQPGVTPQRATDHVLALAWFTAEHAALVALTARAAEAGFEAHTWQLAWTLTEFFARRGHWHDWAATHRHALDAARRQADRLGQAHTHRGLAVAHARLGQQDDAYAHFTQALHQFAEIGDHASQGHTHLGMGWLFARQHRHPEALDHARQALALYRAINDQAGQANALNAVGWYHAQLGDYQQTLVHCEQALLLLRDSDDHRGEASTWDSLGYAHHHLGNHQRATSCCQNAVDLYRKIGDRYNEADALTHLGDAHHAAGHHHDARDTWHQALSILNELGHPDAAELHAKLKKLPGLGGTPYSAGHSGA
jgi:DNA-binding SARP family transcriptional activator/tetratricopeptide (TPR) repeat protein/DNA-binding Xre family transcriptional regulator